MNKAEVKINPESRLSERSQWVTRGFEKKGQEVSDSVWSSVKEKEVDKRNTEGALAGTHFTAGKPHVGINVGIWSWQAFKPSIKYEML